MNENNSFKRNVNLIKNFIDGETDIIKFDNESIPLKKFRELEKSLNPAEKDFKNLVVFWDDAVQFTTLGLIDVLLDSFPDIVNKTWDFDKFFYRTFEDSYYITFVQKLFKEEFNKEFTEEFIKDFFEKHYPEILLKSPASNLLSTIIRCESLYKGVTFVFRYKFDGIEKFILSMRDNHFTKRFNFPINYHALGNSDEFNFLNRFGKDFDIIMIQYLINAIKYIEKNKHFGLSLVSPYGHNGCHESFFQSDYNVFKNRRGPYNSEITIYNEGISVC